MPEAIPNTGARKGPKTITSDAVKKAKSKKLEITPKLPEMTGPENPVIQAKALELKRIQKARTELSNEETKLNDELSVLMNSANLTYYEDDLVEVKPPEATKKFKVTVKSKSEEK